MRNEKISRLRLKMFLQIAILSAHDEKFGMNSQTKLVWKRIFLVTAIAFCVSTCFYCRAANLKVLAETRNQKIDARQIAKVA